MVFRQKTLLFLKFQNKFRHFFPPTIVKKFNYRIKLIRDLNLNRVKPHVWDSTVQTVLYGLFNQAFVEHEQHIYSHTLWIEVGVIDEEFGGKNASISRSPYHFVPANAHSSTCQ